MLIIILHFAFCILNLIFAFVAQLDRASDSDSEGRWFDSSRARQKSDNTDILCLCFLLPYYVKSGKIKENLKIICWTGDEMRRRTKKILLSILIAFLLISAIDFLVNCDFSEDSYRCEECWDGTVILFEYTGDKKYVIVPSEINGKPVGTISETFADNKKVKKVYLKSGITEIGYKTFYQCENLKKVYIPDSVKHIGFSAFESSGIKTINIAQVIGVGERGFYNCKDLYHFVSETYQDLLFGHKAFAETELKHMFFNHTPGYYNDTFTRYCSFANSEDKVTRILLLIPYMSDLISELHNSDKNYYISILVSCGLLIIFSLIVILKLKGLFVDAFMKDGQKQYLAQRDRIINETKKENTTNNLACFKKEERIPEFIKTLLWIIRIILYVYCSFLIWINHGFVGNTKLLLSLGSFLLVTLSPWLIWKLFQFVRYIYRTIKLFAFQRIYEPRIRIIKPRNRKRGKYGK